MDQNKLCDQHKGKICLKVCSHFDCNQNSRWVCQECVDKKLHQHDELISAHIKTISEFRQYLKQEIVELKYQEFMSTKIMEFGVQTINIILINLRDMINLFDDILINTQQIQANIFTLSQIIANSNKNVLTQNQLDEIFKMEKNKEKFFEFNNFQNKLKQIEKQSNQLNNKISQAKKKYLITENVQAYFEISGKEHYLQNNLNNEENFQMQQKLINYLKQQFQDIKPLMQYKYDIDYMNKQDCFLEIQQIQKKIITPKYSILEIKNENQILLACAISPDDKFLVYSSEDQSMHIYDLVDKQLKESKTIDCFPSFMTFTNDSKLLILGNFNGEVLSFDVSNNFLLKIKYKIHKDTINGLRFIDTQQILTCSNDETIIITNIIIWRQDLIISNPPRSRILLIDFDFKNRVIVSSFEDRSIKFFYQEGQQLFQKPNAHKFSISQMQIIQNKNKLISLCLLGKLKIWQIDYRKKEINQTLLISQNIRFKNFMTSQDDNMLTLISYEFVQIHDKFQQNIQQIKHHTDDLQDQAISKEQASKYILVKGKYKLNIICQENQKN